MLNQVDPFLKQLCSKRGAYWIIGEWVLNERNQVFRYLFDMFKHT